MSRAPMDEMRASRQLAIDTNPGSQQPITGSAGNPGLLPMMSNQVDLSWQYYFDKGSLVSAGVFYKKVSDYIGITTDHTTVNGRAATLTRSVNGEGGNVRGLELVAPGKVVVVQTGYLVGQQLREKGYIPHMTP